MDEIIVPITDSVKKHHTVKITEANLFEKSPTFPEKLTEKEVLPGKHAAIIPCFSKEHCETPLAELA